MTHDPQAAALQHYHARFDAAQDNTIGKFLASNLNANRDDACVVDLLIALQSAAFGLRGQPDCESGTHGVSEVSGV